MGGDESEEESLSGEIRREVLIGHQFRGIEVRVGLGEGSSTRTGGIIRAGVRDGGSEGPEGEDTERGDAAGEAIEGEAVVGEDFEGEGFEKEGVEGGGAEGKDVEGENVEGEDVVEDVGGVKGGAVPSGSADAVESESGVSGSVMVEGGSPPIGPITRARSKLSGYRQQAGKKRLHSQVSGLEQGNASATDSKRFKPGGQTHNPNRNAPTYSVVHNGATIAEEQPLEAAAERLFAGLVVVAHDSVLEDVRGSVLVSSVRSVLESISTTSDPSNAGHADVGFQFQAIVNRVQAAEKAQAVAELAYWVNVIQFTFKFEAYVQQFLQLRPVLLNFTAR